MATPVTVMKFRGKSNSLSDEVRAPKNPALKSK
jgi:hypothetical protein